jgi:hypothetical protein
MDAGFESRYLSSNYTTRNLSENLIKLKTCLYRYFLRVNDAACSCGATWEYAYHYCFTWPNYAEIRLTMMKNLN